MTSKARRARGGKAKKEENESNRRRVARHRGKLKKIAKKCSVSGCEKTKNIVEHHMPDGSYKALCPEHHHKANKARGQDVN